MAYDRTFALIIERTGQHPDDPSNAIVQVTYRALLSFADSKTGECFPSYATLSHRAGVSIKSVRDAIATLERLQLVFIRRRLDDTGAYTSNYYTVRKLPAPGFREAPSADDPMVPRTKGVWYSAPDPMVPSSKKPDVRGPDAVEPDSLAQAPDAGASPKNRVTKALITNGWLPTAAVVSELVAEGYTRAFVEGQAASFRDRQISDGKVSADWEAAFRIWVRTASNLGMKGGARTAPRTSGKMQCDRSQDGAFLTHIDAELERIRTNRSLEYAGSEGYMRRVDELEALQAQREVFQALDPNLLRGVDLLTDRINEVQTSRAPAYYGSMGSERRRAEVDRLIEERTSVLANAIPRTEQAA